MCAMSKPGILLLSTLSLLLAACTTATQSALTPTIPEELILTAMQEIAAASTATLQAAASPTPTVTLTPENTATSVPTTELEATQTAAALPTANKGDGVYLAGAEIAFGEWVSEAGSGQDCYWVRRKYDGIVFGSYYGQPGVSMRVEPTDYEVELNGCGTWTYVGS